VIVAPVVFRILFAEAPLTLEQLNEQIDLAHWANKPPSDTRPRSDHGRA